MPRQVFEGLALPSLMCTDGLLTMCNGRLSFDHCLLAAHEPRLVVLHQLNVHTGLCLEGIRERLLALERFGCFFGLRPCGDDLVVLYS
ncbi:hypothetical protein E2562_000219 [Oryza meyeriana var. granulata]|uniref:Uncharacterized protein n=1 Tax=Oryza meyeriana var. granulata TaxID=110450 RepID=A0A6G1CL07_9ORYZ|nr:hypothetical protein E2562_000219 [Oryza meyeriana var. granulata]